MVWLLSCPRGCYEHVEKSCLHGSDHIFNHFVREEKNEWSTKLTSKAWRYFGTKIHSYINQVPFYQQFYAVDC